MGTGKSTVASLLPLAIAPNAYDCGDVLEVDCAQENGVADIDAIVQGFMSFSPFNSSGKRFVIFEEADMLTPQAQRLLKRPLETKANHLMCIMTTNHPEKLNPEMLDRFAKFEFRTLPIDKMSALATRVLADQDITLPAEMITQIVNRSDNSFRCFFRLLDEITEALLAKKADSQIVINPIPNGNANAPIQSGAAVQWGETLS